MGEKDIIFIVESAFDALTINQYIHRLGRNWAVIGTCGTHGVKTEKLIKFIKESNPIEVAKIVASLVPFTQLLPMMTSSEAVVQNQETGNEKLLLNQTTGYT